MNRYSRTTPGRQTATALAARHLFTSSYRPMTQAQHPSATSNIEPTGANLRDLREAKELSRTQVAQRFGMSAQALANIEAGRQGLGPGEYERIAEAIEKLAGRRSASNDADGGKPKQERQQPDDAGDAEAKGPFDWRAHLQPELAALLDGDPTSAAAIVGEQDAGKAKRRLLGLARQQDAVEKDEHKQDVQTQALRAARFIAGRKLNGWDQEESARRLGYANSTQLSLLESGSRRITLNHIVNASKVYRVSADFLLGTESSEHELDIRARIGRRFGERLHTFFDAITGSIDAEFRAAGGATASTVRCLTGHAKAVVSAFHRMDPIALNGVKGGETMGFAVEELEAAVLEAVKVLAGYEAEMDQLRHLLRATPANDEYEREKTAPPYRRASLTVTI